MFVNVISYLLFCQYGVVCFLGVIGNLLVIVVVATHRSMRTVTNLLITNLALSDILLSAVATPFTPISMHWEVWTLPAALCKILPMVMSISVYVSALTCTTIALNRYQVIIKPGFMKAEIQHCIVAIGFIWSSAILISMPLGFYQTIITSDNTSNASHCVEKWPIEGLRQIFTGFNLIFQFILPGTIILLCYKKVSSALRQQCVSNSLSGPKTRYDLQRKRHTNQMLIVMTIVFWMCWIPLNMWMVATDISSIFSSPNSFNKSNANEIYGNDERSGENDSSHELDDLHVILFYCCHICAMTSAACNPFIYVWMNENFKLAFYNLILCRRAPFHANRSLPFEDGSNEDVSGDGNERVLSFRLNVFHKRNKRERGVAGNIQHSQGYTTVNDSHVMGLSLPSSDVAANEVNSFLLHNNESRRLSNSLRNNSSSPSNV